MTDLVPVTFSVFFGRQSASRIEQVEDLYTASHGGVDVTVEPTDVKGEFRVSGLFPKSFAEARGY
jgi:hypothetical protein